MLWVIFNLVEAEYSINETSSLFLKCKINLILFSCIYKLGSFLFLFILIKTVRELCYSDVPRNMACINKENWGLHTIRSLLTFKVSRCYWLLLQMVCNKHSSPFSQTQEEKPLISLQNSSVSIVALYFITLEKSQYFHERWFPCCDLNIIVRIQSHLMRHIHGLILVFNTPVLASSSHIL